ncbi:MAG: hypothetical protein ABFS03_03925 [Chloroflexota bacterium]
MSQQTFYDYRQKPSTWEDAGDLVNSTALDRLLRQQLIYIAFTANPQVSVRAIALLREIPVNPGDSDFSALSLAEIDAKLAQLEQESPNIDYAKIPNKQESESLFPNEETVSKDT